MSKNINEPHGLNKIFTKELTTYYKENKQEITPELLDTLRSYGNPGKKKVLDILETPLDYEKYYLDAFENRISFNGNRMLKKAYTKMDLSEIHKEEIAKCANDIYYFMDNYIRINTKKGVDFPELRPYQRDFIEVMVPDENESIVSLQPRQSGKSVTVGIYLLWMYIFEKDMVIGIAANKGSMAREFLNKVKKMFLELPIWMQTGTTIWNKSNIESENGMVILTDSTNGDSFRGFTCNIVVVDETAFIKTSMWEEFADSIFPAQSGLAFKKTILISTANGLNMFYQIINGSRTDSIIEEEMEVDKDFTVEGKSIEELYEQYK